MKNKKILCQFFTNNTISKFMASWIMENNPKNVLEPSAGDGALIRAILDINHNINIDAIDIDKTMCSILSNIIDEKSIINTDYLQANINKYDAIICNPPYNKFHNIQNRKFLVNDFNNKYNIKLNGYTNLYAFFIVKSLNELNLNGRCAYIVPYEFLNTGYGKIIKDYFIKTKSLQYIIKFNNKLDIFNDAITTSCILLFENKIHDTINFVSIENIEELNPFLNFKNNITYKYDDLVSSEKWINYFNKVESHNNNNLIQIKEIGKVKRGIATGNNNYFTLNKQKIKDFNLSQEVCMPCITKSADISNIILDNTQFYKLKNMNKKVFIFNGKEAINKKDYEYINIGEKEGVNKTYLTSKRKPWYSIEEKQSAPILLSVFCRNKIKVIRNEAMIKNLTTFHGLYFNSNTSDDNINILFCYLLTPIAQKILFKNKREYGSGLDKFEPNDLNNSQIININKIKKNDKDEILRIYKQLKNSYNEQSIKNLNLIFSNYVA